MRDMLRQKAGLVLAGCLTLGAGSYWLFGGSGSEANAVALVGDAPRKSGPAVPPGEAHRRPSKTPSKIAAKPGDRRDPPPEPSFDEHRRPRPRPQTNEQWKPVRPGA